MSLLDEARGVDTNPGPSCAIGKLIDAGKLNLDELREAFNSSVETSAICRALRSRGFEGSDSQVRIHRRNDCAGCRTKGRFTS